MRARHSWATPWIIGLAAFVLVCCLSAATTAQPTTQPQPPAEEEQLSEPAPTPEAKPLRGPKYLNLRYDEDFSYLDGPEDSYEADFFDPIKRIHLSDDLTLSLGGSFRARLESETNKAFGSSRPAQDTFFLHQYRLFADFRYRKLARVFVEGISAHIEDRDLPLLSTHENRYDLHQLFIDFRVLGEDVPLTVRVGRQELQYGKQRMISPLGWANTRRRFDAAKIFYEHETFNLDVFYARPVPIDLSESLNRKPDTYREEAHFYGLYWSYKAIPRHVFDLYFLGLNDDGGRVNANGRIGDESVYTIGGRLAGHTGAFDYEGELAGQWGTFAGDTVQAWGGGVDAGYTWKQSPWSPRLGVGFDYGSGDDDPTDRTHGTFNQLFPLGHAYLGYMDLFGRQNVLATNVNLTFKPIKKLTTRLAWHTFWNDSKKDALYNAGGGPGRRDTSGSSGHDVGNELDITMKYAIDPHSSVLLGYSHFWGNNFIRSTGPSQDADFIYLQYEFKF